MAKNRKNRGNNSGNRGFAAMDPDKQREIASKGGKASHESGRGNQFNSRSGQEAGQKGGRNSSSQRNDGRGNR
jgi:uncharacterized protein